MKRLFLKKTVCALLCMMILFSGALASISPGKYKIFAQEDDLEVHFVDVGQGDCIIIQFPDGKTMIVDAGDKNSQTEQKILGYIESNFSDLDYFDYAIVTHTDSDHLGCMDEVLEAYPAMTVYRPNVIATREGFTDPVLSITQDSNVNDQNQKLWNDQGASVEVYEKETIVYKEFIEQAYQSFEIDGTSYTPKVIVSDGRRNDRPQNKATQDIEGENYSVTFYSPLSYSYSDVNDYSNIFVLEHKGFEFFLSGDAEKHAEEQFVEEYKDEDFDIDVFKFGHHGSRSSTTKELLELITKQQKRDQSFGVISCGEGNKYEHPHSEALDRFFELGFSQNNLLRTDLINDIVFEVRQENGVYNLYYKDTVTREEKDDVFKQLEEFVNKFLADLFQGEIYAIIVLAVIIAVIIIVIIIIRQNSSKHKKK